MNRNDESSHDQLSNTRIKRARATYVPRISQNSKHRQLTYGWEQMQINDSYQIHHSEHCFPVSGYQPFPSFAIACNNQIIAESSRTKRKDETGGRAKKQFSDRGRIRQRPW
jgi:hypothetical protein